MKQSRIEAVAAQKQLIWLMEATKSKLQTAHRRQWTAISILGFSVILSLYVVLFLSRMVAFEAQQVQEDKVATTSIPEPVPSSCQGKQIYMYDLPPEFNTELLVPFCQGKVESFDYLCETLAEGGLGPPMMQELQQQLPPVEEMVLMTPWRRDAIARMRQNLTFYEQLWEESEKKLVPAKAWFNTDQFALELLFHNRMKLYPCLTTDPSQATLFYVPFYAGLDATSHLFSKWMQLRDRLANRLLGWLTAQQPWREHPERHILVLGRIVWDFSRQEASEGWGTSLLRMPELLPAMKLLIERNTNPVDSPDSVRQAGMPYPTSFHPASDEEVRVWKKAVAASRRTSLVSFVGARREGNTGTNAAPVRDRIFRECSADSGCALLDCADLACSRYPRLVMALNLRSAFCLQPAGDSPTRRAIFDAMLAGCIPVFFSLESAYLQYPWHLPPMANSSSWSVLVPADDARLRVVPFLASIPKRRVRSMRRAVMDLVPSLVYSMPGHDRQRSFSDAFDLAIAASLLDAS